MRDGLGCVWYYRGQAWLTTILKTTCALHPFHPNWGWIIMGNNRCVERVTGDGKQFSNFPHCFSIANLPFAIDFAAVQGWHSPHQFPHWHSWLLWLQGPWGPPMPPTPHFLNLQELHAVTTSYFWVIFRAPRYFRAPRAVAILSLSFLPYVKNCPVSQSGLQPLWVPVAGDSAGEGTMTLWRYFISVFSRNID